MTEKPIKPTDERNPRSNDKPTLPVIDVQHLLGGGREIVIVHAGERYHLRITGNNKLILTK